MVPPLEVIPTESAMRSARFVPVLSSVSVAPPLIVIADVF